MRRCLERGPFSYSATPTRGNDGTIDLCVTWDWIRQASRAALNHTRVHTHVHEYTQTLKHTCPSPRVMSGSSQMLDEQGTGKAPQSGGPYFPKQNLPGVRTVLGSSLAAAVGECSPSPHPLLPCQLLVFPQIPAERAFCKETSSASKPKSGSYSYPTLLAPGPSAACSQAFMLATIWSVSPTHLHRRMLGNSSGNWHIIGAH